MPTLTRPFTAVLLLVTAMLAAGIAAQGPAGAPDPARLPGRPGLPGTSAPGSPGTAAPTTTAPSAAATNDPGTAAISGRVTAADTGLPVRRARVTLRGRENPQGQVTLTDADGAFAFRGLTAGHYTVVAGKARYVDTHYGARRPGGFGRPMQLFPGQTRDDIALTLATAGVITGRVLDDAGEPVVGAQVMTMRYQSMPGGRRLVPAGPSHATDDTGGYRLFGLAPGRYYIAAQADDVSRFGGDVVGPGVTGLVATYHPSTAVASEAQPIVVTPGTELTADITLIPTTLTRVAGTVVDAGGRVPIGGFVNLMTADGAGMMGGGGGAPIVKGGTFTMSAVPPGDYMLHVRADFEEGETPRGLSSLRGRDGNPGFSLPVSVGAAGLADVRVVIPSLMELAGRVVFEGGQPDGTRTVMVMATTSAGGPTGFARAEAAPDGRFALRLRPGSWQFWAGAPRGWMIRRIEFRGRDVERGASVDVSAEPGARLEITLTNQLTRLTGTVVDGSRQPVLDYRVIVFPRDEELARRTADGVRLEVAGADGRFEIVALPPGDYLTVAVADFDASEEFDLDVLDAYRDAATPVRMAHGDAQTLTLTLAALP